MLCVLKACFPLVLSELGARAALQLWLLVAETFSQSLNCRASCFEGARMEQFHESLSHICSSRKVCTPRW